MRLGVQIKVLSTMARKLEIDSAKHFKDEFHFRKTWKLASFNTGTNFPSLVNLISFKVSSGESMQLLTDQRILHSKF